MHSGVYFRTQLNYPTTVGLFEARFEALSEEAFRLVLLSERCSPLGTGPHTLFMERRFFPTQDGVDISYSWPRESSVCCLWLVLPPGVGCVCVCVCVRTCMFTPADHSPGGRRARWGAGGGEPPAVSRACSRALSLPVLLSGDVRCPGLRPPRPTFSSQEDPRAPPACDPRPEALQTVSGGCLGVCLVCSSVGNHCPVPTHVWNVCWVGAESSPRCVLSVEADVLLRGCRSAAILLVRGEET